MGKLAKRQPADLEHYDPEQGLKNIAVAEAAELHARRARDPAKLANAVEVKLTAQRDFILWWDGQGLKKGGRPKTLSDLKELIAGKDGIPDSVTIHRWRRRLKADNDFEGTLALALERCVAICEAAAHVAAAQNAGQSEWYTPKEIISAARKVFGEIDLDPASTDEAQTVIQAKRYYTPKENGLIQPWAGRVWLNPPYSQPLIEQFISQLLSVLVTGEVTAAITLTNNATETEWGQALLRESPSVCFHAGRVKFWAPGRESIPLQGQMLCYFGPEQEKFAVNFEHFGAMRGR